MLPRYQDRRDAGQQLAHALSDYQHREDVLVLALPRGGVPVAFEVARQLDAEMDLLVVRKLGVPGYPEFAMGAIAAPDVKILDHELINRLRLNQTRVAAVIEREKQELSRRERLYRAGRPPPPLKDRIVLVVDDGIATGASMKAALEVVRAQHPARLVAAAPVGPPEVARRLAGLADEVVCLYTPADFRSVGQYYQHFEQTSDQEVHDLVASARLPREQAP